MASSSFLIPLVFRVNYHLYHKIDEYIWVMIGVIWIAATQRLIEKYLYYQGVLRATYVCNAIGIIANIFGM
jgi:hypothetical protein